MPASRIEVCSAMPETQIGAVPSPLTYRIVVPTFRRPKDLGRLLGAIETQLIRHPDAKLVVVNDGSHDDRYAAVIAPYAHLIDYRPQPQNRGVQYARQAGCADATEDILVFTDDDCTPDRHWLDWLFAVVEAHPSADMFCGGTWPINSDPPRLLERFLQFTGRHPMPLERGGRLIVAPHANFAIKREAFERVGGLDMRFNIAEDWNLTFRLLAAGAVYVIDRDWSTMHGEGQSVLAYVRRWYGYGGGAAKQTLIVQEWRTLMARPQQTVLATARHLRGVARNVRSRCIEHNYPFGPRLCFIAWELLFSAAYQYGWMKTQRRLSKDLGLSLPTPAPLGDDLADFVKRGRVTSGSQR
jgi:hypothetical protein